MTRSIVCCLLASGLSGLFAFQALAEEKQWGDIQGQIVLAGQGKVPPRQEIRIRGGPIENKIFSDDWVVNPENRGIKDVFVWLRPVGAKKTDPFPVELIHPALAKITKETLEIELGPANFRPFAFGARVGQKLAMKNTSAAARNASFDSTENGTCNRLILADRKFELPKPLVFERSPILIQCSTHPWMKANLRIFDHPYFALTDENGKFEIKNAPVGQFQIYYWHPTEGYLGGAAGQNGYPVEIKKEKNDLGKQSMEGPESTPAPVKYVDLANPPQPGPNPPPQPAPDADAVWGAFHGQVVWKGDIPERKPLDFGNHPAKAVCEKEKNQLDDELIINPASRGVKDTFVWLHTMEHFPTDKIHPRFAKAPEAPMVFEQSSCRYTPHAAGARAGQTLIIKNESSITHKSTWYSLRNLDANATLSKDGKTLEFQPLAADPWPITLKCGGQPWMKAHLRVFDPPYFTVTDDDGAFKIDDAPVGEFVLYIWHPVKGWVSRTTIAIAKGDKDLGRFEMK